MAKKKSNAGKIGLVGAAAAAAAAAGAYYFIGSKNAEKNRARVSDFAQKAEARIVKETKKGVKKIAPKVIAEIKKAKKKFS